LYRLLLADDDEIDIIHTDNVTHIS